MNQEATLAYTRNNNNTTGSKARFFHPRTYTRTQSWIMNSKKKKKNPWSETERTHTRFLCISFPFPHRFFKGLLINQSHPAPKSTQTHIQTHTHTHIDTHLYYYTYAYNPIRRAY